MAQRILDAAFWDDEDIASLSLGERLLFICMVTDVSLSDDYGRLPAGAKTLKKHAFGYDDDVTVEQVQQWRDNILRQCHNVVLYQVGGQEYIWLKSFGKWQRLRHHRKTNIPNPPPQQEDCVNPPADSGKVPESDGNFRLDRIGEDRVEKDGIGEDGENPPLPPSSFTETAIRAFESNIGLVSGALQSDEILDILGELEERHIEPWWEAALKVAVDGNKRSWAYVRGVLRSCLAEGRPPGGRNGNGNGARGSPAQRPEPVKRMIKIIDPLTQQETEVEARI